MKNILIIGAGRSSSFLIKYLLDKSLIYNWNIKVADYSVEIAKKSILNHVNGQAIFFNVLDDKQREQEIISSSIVISMLPASMHLIVAKDCVRFKKNLITASYVSDDIIKLDSSAKKAGVMLLNEIGLDPGLDHMSAMMVIDKIKESGSELISFKSFCGGLVHPKYDNNPWNYKFTWNPRNVVLAGQGTAKFIQEGTLKYIPYSSLFKRTECLNILDLGEFEGYANRDSLSYRKIYNLEKIPTLLRGTLRKKGYSEAWNIFVQLGMTNDKYKLEQSHLISNRQFLNMFLPFHETLSLEEKFCKHFKLSKYSEIYKKIEWLDFFKNINMSISNASPAQLLQAILEKKWTLDTYDKDMIIMQHQFNYISNELNNSLKSSLVVFGDDSKFTAMAKTVGLPVAIATKLILEDKINLSGVQIPVSKQIYLPILKELEDYGIIFVEELI